MHPLARTLRSLRRAPVFSSVVLLTLGFSIAAATAMFAIVDAVQWGARPYPRPMELVHLQGLMTREQDAEWPLSYLDIEEIRTRVPQLAQVAGRSSARSFNLVARDGSVAHVSGEMVSAEYFDILGMVPAIGRVFDAREERAPGAQPLVVLGHALHQRLGGGPELIGQSITLNDRAYRIIGVMPAGVLGLSDGAELWLPLGYAREAYVAGYTEVRPFRWLSAVARLAPGVPLDQAQQGLNQLGSALLEQHPQDNRGLSYRASSLDAQLLGEVRRPAQLLLGGAMLIVLLACTNLTGLFSVRVVRARDEMGIREALGATRWQRAAPLVGEAAVLVVSATILGVLASQLLVQLLASQAILALPSFVHATPNVRVALAVAGLVIVATATFAAVPLVASRFDRVSSMRGAARVATAPASVRRLFASFSAVEAAIALTLLASTALLAKGLSNYLNAPLGFEPRQLITARLDLTGQRYQDDARVRALVTQLEERLRATPGVTAVATEGPGLPTFGRFGVTVRADDAPEAEASFTGLRHHVTPGYFTTLGARIERGRDFTPADRDGAPLVAIVSPLGARRLFGDANPVGRELVTVGNPSRRWTVVGVASDIRHMGRDQGAEWGPDIYFPTHQTVPRNPALLTILVRGSAATATIPATIRRAVAEIDPMLPVYDERAMSDRLGTQTARTRFLTWLMTGFALTALLLAALGLFGTVAFLAAQRAREHAIRMALGASMHTVLRETVRDAMLPVLGGVLLGLAMVAASSRMLAAHLFGVPPLDPVPILAAALVLLAATLAAVAVPARRASATPLTVLLRSD